MHRFIFLQSFYVYDFPFSVLGLDSYVFTCELLLGWMWCTIQGVSVLCVVSVMTMIVVNINIGAHDKDGTKGCHDKLYINKYCSITRLKDLEQPLSPNTICIYLNHINVCCQHGL
jgi:hypothetical protein